MDILAAGGEQLPIGGKRDMINFVEVVSEDFNVSPVRNCPGQSLVFPLPADFSRGQVDLVEVEAEGLRENRLPEKFVVGDGVPSLTNLE